MPDLGARTDGEPEEIALKPRRIGSFERLGELLRGRHQARIFRRRLRHKMIRRDWGPEMLETPQPRLGKTWRETVRYLLHA